MTSKVAVVRVRGTIRSEPVIRKTLKLLKLERQNYCVVVDKTPSNMGMVTRVKDYTTFGEISDETFKLMCDKLPEGKEKGFFRLNPPVKGYGKNGIKTPFAAKGALGDRKDKMDELIRRMLK